ncbi:MAG: hypothetical protein R3F48_10380 [Candidatus Zixiibacteriota bacterium]
MHKSFFVTTAILILVFSTALFAQDYIDLSTPNHVLRIYNDGRLVDGNENVAFDFIEDCDTFNVNTNSDIYLYKGTPMIGYINGTDTLLFHMYDNATPEVNGFVSTAPIGFDDSDPAYSYAKTSFETANGAFGLTQEYFASKDSWYADFIVVRTSFFAKLPVIPKAYFATLLDWNIPSDSGTRNSSGFYISDNLMYQSGAEFNQDDSTEALCPQESDDRYGAIWAYADTPQNAFTFANSQFLPFSHGDFYSLIANEEGYSVYNPTNPDSQYVDLSTVMTMGGYAMVVGDTIQFVYTLGISKSGISDLMSQSDESFYFIQDHGIAGPYNCCVVAGDANNDGGLNIGDAVYLITYIFKGGPPPPCPYAADTNGDCAINIGDVIGIIRPIFEQGWPAIQCAPSDCEYDL